VLDSSVFVRGNTEFGMDAALLSSTSPATYTQAGQVSRSLETGNGQSSKAAHFPALTLGENTMSKLLAVSSRFVRDEEGASLVEYGLLLALIAVVCLGAVATLGTSISALLSGLGGSI
jgi:pilus assembly protein Flp/PilA